MQNTRHFSFKSFMMAAVVAVAAASAVHAAVTWKMIFKVNEPNSVAVNPKDTRNIFVFASGKGVYRTTDGGASWSLKMSNPGRLYSDLHVDPVDPKIVYCAVGNFGTGSGFYRSADAGQTWTQLGPAHGLKSATDNYYLITSLPTTPQTLLVWSGSGIYRSTNGGTQWVKATTPTSIPGYPRALSACATNKNIVYGMSSGYLFKSTDAGKTWTQVGRSPDSYTYHMAVHPTNPNILFTAVTSLSKMGIWKSTNGGVSWTKMTAYTKDATHIAVDYANPSVMYAASSSNGIYETTNGGSTWTLKAVLRTTRCIEMDPKDHNVVYVGSASGNGTTSIPGGVYKRMIQ